MITRTEQIKNPIQKTGLDKKSLGVCIKRRFRLWSRM